MGLLDMLKSQFIEVIEWLDDSSDTLVWRFPVRGQEIKMGARLIVREGQVAVFINEGKLADQFGPGTHTLSTQNVPLLTKLMSWPYGFNSPFKAEVYFVSTRRFTARKWGTQNPIMVRDPEIGPVRLRAFGGFGFRVEDPSRFLTEVTGTDGDFDTAGIEESLRQHILTAFTDALGEAKVPALDLASNYRELGKKIQGEMGEHFTSIGLQLSEFNILNISLPPEVEKMLDKRSSMGLVGNLDQFTQFQAANALEQAASNPSGLAGAGVALGAGFGMADQMGRALGGARGGAVAPPAAAVVAAPAAAAAATRPCGACGAAVTAGAKFCPDCGARQSPANCTQCGASLAPQARFCGECGTKAG